VDTAVAVIEALARAPEIVVPLVREVPVAVRKWRPAPGKWSAHEHACHLAVVHGLFLSRLDQMLREPAPVIRPYDPGADDPPDRLTAMDLERALDQYVADREMLVARLRTLSPADWERQAAHASYNRYSTLIMFRHLALHDFLHAYRIEEILLSRAWEDSLPASSPSKAASPTIEVSIPRR
jgi:hypothetical protein